MKYEFWMEGRRVKRSKVKARQEEHDVINTLSHRQQVERLRVEEETGRVPLVEEFVVQLIGNYSLKAN